MLCEHGNITPCVECDIEPLKAENESLHRDISALVEALEECAASLAWNCFGECRAIHDGPIMPASGALEMARKALAAHQKRETSHDNQ